MMSKKALLLKGIAAALIISSVSAIILNYYLTRRGSLTKPFSSSEVTVVDALGRKVTLPYPVKRVIVTDDEVAELVQIVGAADRVVGIESSIRWRGYFPEMANKPITGSQFRGLNYELVAKLRPDAVIMMDVGPIGKIISKLNSLGIKCIVVSISPSKIPETINLLGKVFGKERRAKELINWWNQKWRVLEERLKPLEGKPKLKVFVGMGFAPTNRLPLHTWGKLAKWNYILSRIHMVNIASAKLKYHGELDEEYLVEQDPDIIVIGDWSDNWLGYTKNSTAAAKAMVQEVLKDPVLRGVKAVKEHHVYVMYYVMLGSFRSVIGAYYLAKAAYPNLMKGINPDLIQQEYFQRWLGVPYRGIWFYPESWNTSVGGG